MLLLDDGFDADLLDDEFDAFGDLDPFGDEEDATYEDYLDGYDGGALGFADDGFTDLIDGIAEFELGGQGDWFELGEAFDGEGDPYADYAGSPEAEALLAEMQRYADLAAAAESEGEADEFLAGAIRLVPSLIRAAAPIVKRLGRTALRKGVAVARAAASAARSGARALVAAGRAVVPQVARLVRLALARVRAMIRSRRPGLLRKFVRLIPRIVARAASALSRLGPRLTLNQAVRIVQRISFTLLRINVNVNTTPSRRPTTTPGRRQPRPTGARRVVRPRYCVL